jgi:insertion element IS1 protein InsB
VDRASRRTVACVLGSRDAATFQRLYDKVKHLTHCTFYTDDWDVFAKVLPAERHIVGMAHTILIKQDNSNTRHHLGRMTRRNKVVSKKEEMADATMKLWCTLTQPETFAAFQRVALSIYR